jgi:serine/threonine-protein kinase
LILLDVSYRRLQGASPLPQEYLARFPTLDAAWLEDALSAGGAPGGGGQEAGPDGDAGGAPSSAHPGSTTPETPAGEAGAGDPLASRPSAVHVPGYEVCEEIGRGGMGVVHRARDRRLRRELAVKVLRDKHRHNADLVRCFVEEAQIAGQLQHPGVAPVYELGELADRRPYFTMKLVRGETLADLLKRRKSPGGDLPRWLAVFAQVCQTLAYAHAHRVLHRDLKPGNVMVGEFGEVQVMDWGFAKVLAAGGGPETGPATGEQPTAIETVRRDAPEAASQTGAVMGTYDYMPPEQARGEVGRLDERCDVFGLGAILCEILTGRPPYTGTHEEIRCKAEAPDLRDAFARLDGCGAEAELVRIARACLAAEPAERPRDAGAAAGLVTAYLAGVQERLRTAEVERAAAQAKEAEAKAKAVAERRARQVTVGLAASVVLTVVLLGGGGGWLLWQQAQTTLAVETDLGTATAAAERGDDQDAREALERAEGRLAGGGFDALRQRVEALRGELDFAAELEEARMKALETTTGNVGLDWAGADAAYARAFAGRELDVTGPGAAAALERIGRSPVRGRVVTALDAWAGVRRRAGAGAWKELLEAAGRADDSGDAARRRLREAALQEDTGGLLALAGESGVADWPPADAVLLAHTLLAAGEREAAVRVLRAARVRNGGDFWINASLGDILGHASAASREEGIGFWRAAVAARPRAAAAHNNLGALLAGQGKSAEAEKEYREALRLKPDLPEAHTNLGNLLADQGKAAEAEKEYREALRLQPDYPDPHYNLGKLLQEQGRAEEAEREYREALRLKPDYPEAHTNLGVLLADQGKHEEAEKEYREALRIKPDYLPAHNNLGVLLVGQGRPAEAEGEYREAIRIQPDNPEAHCNLGLLLRDQGRFREALDELRRGHELGTRDPRWNYPSAKWVEDCRRLVECDALLPAVLNGAAEPSNAEAALGFARVCQHTKRHAAAARLSAAAMEATLGAANDPRTGLRYHAACSAALAGCGRGDDAPAGDAERARLRGRAVDWLRADLARWAKAAESGDPNARAAVKATLSHWKEDPDLAGVRDKDCPEMLPEAEREKWRRLWADVDAVLQKAASPK